VDHDKGHLEEDLELVGDDVWAAIREGFGAIAALEEEAAALFRLGEEDLEAFDFP
jgi:hypothetical protein